MIIVEGVDATGKTTVARHLALELGWRYKHHGYRPNEDIVSDYLAQLRESPSNIIYDRSVFSEIVYGTVLRGFSRCPIELIKAELGRGDTTKIQLIYCGAPPTTILQRLQNRRESSVFSLDIIERLCSAYERLMNELPLNHIYRYDSLTSSDSSLRDVLRWCRKPA